MANKVGRPTKLTDKVLDDIVGILRLGLSERTAQEFVGVDHSTFERWKKREDNNFATTIKKAQAEARIKMIIFFSFKIKIMTSPIVIIK